MLVLSRKAKERIQIDTNIFVTVLEIRRNTVRIGIEAPKEIHILRTELQNVIAGLPICRVLAAVAPPES